MVRPTMLHLGAALFIGLNAFACASSSSSSTNEPSTPAAATTASSTLSVKVLNEHASAGTFVLFIEPVGGVRQSLGTVQAGTSPNFSFAANRGSAYVLIQQTETGDVHTSERFTYTPPTSVTWDMNTRRLAVARR